MFYRPSDGHGLPHSPFNAIVAPRPIGWISTRGALGDNLAPYSFFNAVAYSPPQVVFAGDLKDSIRNIRETGVFATNVVSEPLWQVMNATSAPFPHGTDEFTRVGIEKSECSTIDCPRVTLSPATLECRLQQIVTLQGGADLNWSSGSLRRSVAGWVPSPDCVTGGVLTMGRYRIDRG